ncbi:hypothetical protein [Bilophila wadsworthia]|nr:hypothetical protein [Bilophila wadsworthia]MDU4375108.1 hypothetical protein [Bilophila wadsworthia]
MAYRPWLKAGSMSAISGISGAGTFFTLEYMAPVFAARASCPSGVLM